MMHQAEANASPFSVPTLLKSDRFKTLHFKLSFRQQCFLLLTFKNRILEVYPTYEHHCSSVIHQKPPIVTQKILHVKGKH